MKELKSAGKRGLRCSINEAAAYEALWLNEKSNFATLANIFSLSGGSLPSEVVSNIEISSTKNELLKFLENKGLHDVGLAINGSIDYPLQLRDAVNPVEILYYMGDWSLVNTRRIAIIGSRKVSFDGVQRTHRAAKFLSEQGFTIVSGLAEGVDIIAHLSAIKYGGNTIAVIGTPIGDYYPKKHKEIQDNIAKNHLLISPIPFLRYNKQDYRKNKNFFPERNAVMSAISEATLIIEASDKSGTLTQARQAIAQGRKLFILNNCFEDESNSWPWEFEKKGAIRVRRPEDIVDYL